MRIEITGKGLDLTDAITSYAEKKCEKLTKFYDGVQEIEAVLDQESHKNTTDYIAEIIVHAVAHDPFVAKVVSNDIYAALDQATDKMTRQLRDFKDKLRKHT